MDIVLLLVGLVIGAVVGLAIAHARRSGTLAERDAAREAAQTARTERDTVAADRQELEARLRAAESMTAGLEAQLAAERQATVDKLTLLEQAQAQLKDVFGRMSLEALERSNRAFLDLADSRFKEAGAPLAETLGRVETQLREIETERVGAQRALAQQIEFVRTTGEQLRSETSALVDALRKPQARGRWGELQLRRCVEHAGMTDRCDFLEQETVSTADGLLRPDLVIRLVGGKSVLVDSKVTLAAYLEAHESADASVRESRLAAHAKHLRQHVDALAAKAYWSQFSPAPEFVVLFVPGEAFLAPALERDAQLLDYAFSKRVHIATPTTLVSLLRTAAYAWQQDALAANAREVFDLGRELYKRLSTFGGKIETLGKRLGSAVGAYNETVGSLERTVLPQARRFRDLQVIDDDLTAAKPIEEPIRTVSSPELVASAEQARALVALPPPAVPEGATVVAAEIVDDPADYGLAGSDEAVGPSAASLG